MEAAGFSPEALNFVGGAFYEEYANRQSGCGEAHHRICSMCTDFVRNEKIV